MRNYYLNTNPRSPHAISVVCVDGDGHSIDCDGNFSVFKNSQLVAYVPAHSLVSVEVREPRR